MSSNDTTSMFDDRRQSDRRGENRGAYIAERRQRPDRRIKEFSTQPWWLQRSLLDRSSH